MAAVPPLSNESHHTDSFWSVIIVIIIVCELVSEVVFVSNLSIPIMAALLLQLTFSDQSV